ncbi:hypothetical protein MLD38_016387 [Melastoma candidum]|uniref:Uncharacterized protein n=1 Tax=Melastoma candidum TaxID=119954 RepID=A0ACB9RJD9_9MYRT|nr:hypothetical protein MLD38_016387 [Melastoma candidum]
MVFMWPRQQKLQKQAMGKWQRQPAQSDWFSTSNSQESSERISKLDGKLTLVAATNPGRDNRNKPVMKWLWQLVVVDKEQPVMKSRYHFRG